MAEPTEHERMAAAFSEMAGAIGALDRARHRIGEILGRARIGDMDHFTFEMGYRKGLRTAIAAISDQMREEQG